MTDPARAGATGSKMLGVVLFILGFLAIGTPYVAGTAAVMVIGIFLIAGGLTMTFASMGSGGGIWGVLFGAITALAGISVVARPYIGLASITLMLAIYFGVQGVAEIIAAFQGRPAPGWGVYLFGGVVSLLLSYMIFSEWPMSGAWAVGVLVGIRLMFSGMAMMMVGGAISAGADAVENP